MLLGIAFEEEKVKMEVPCDRNIEYMIDSYYVTGVVDVDGKQISYHPGDFSDILGGKNNYIIQAAVNKAIQNLESMNRPTMVSYFMKHNCSKKYSLTDFQAYIAEDIENNRLDKIQCMVRLILRYGIPDSDNKKVVYNKDAKQLRKNSKI
jgi:hypothetical protein